MTVVLRSVTGPPGTRLQAWLDSGRHTPESYRTVARPETRLVAAIDGGTDATDSAPGAASPEVAGAVARDGGRPPTWGSPVEVGSLAEVVALARDRGRHSVDVVRSDPDLLGLLQVGAWFDGGWRSRVIRRTFLRLPALPPRVLGAVPIPLLWRTAVDAAFWAGVRERATASEWKRWTSSSFVALCYHRLAGDDVPGQEHLDVAPDRFAKQLRILRRLRFHALSQTDVIDFVAGRVDHLPRRSYVVTCDDGYVDAVGPLAAASKHHPALFVLEDGAGATAWFLDDEPLASWDELQDAARRGVTIGSHSRGHRVLPELEDGDLDHELVTPDELRAHVPEAVPALAYPHGRHDPRVRAATRAKGWQLAWTTDVGRNGAGTDRWTLRRISVHDDDGVAVLLWKALTGELVPPAWERRRRRQQHPASTPPPAGPAPMDGAAATAPPPD